MAHRVGEVLQPLDLRLLSAGELGETSLVGLSCGPVVRVGAAVLDELGAVEVKDASDGLVEQDQVVAYDHECAPVALEEFHHPRPGVVVEVVGGLVQEQHVAAREQDACELYPATLSSREGIERQVEAVGRHAQP